MYNEYVKTEILPFVNFEIDDAHLQDCNHARISKYLIGEIYTSTHGYDFKIIKAYKGNSIRQIEFLNTGYRRFVESKDLFTKAIIDPYEPTVCGVGIVGEAYNRNGFSKNILYRRWIGIIRRCYDQQSNTYINSGAKECRMSDEWLYYPRFVADIKKKQNYLDLINDSINWSIDKDILSNNEDCKLYSNETTCIITLSDNVKERNVRNGNPSKYRERKVAQYTKNGDFVHQFDTVKEAIISIKGNSEALSHICNVCSGKAKTAFGFIWRYVD
jgi:hypothetical protein